MTHGKQSKDFEFFSESGINSIANAADDLRLLLSKSYGMNESLQLVSNHFRLTSRQRQFLYRCVSPPEKAVERNKKILKINDIYKQNLFIDGYNCLIITECCLAGGIVMLTDDGLLRDIQGLSGSFRMSENTEEALHEIVSILVEFTPQHTTVFLNERMDNCLQVQNLWQDLMDRNNLLGELKRVKNADHALRNSTNAVIATSDRRTIDQATFIVDIPRAVADKKDDVNYITLTK